MLPNYFCSSPNPPPDGPGWCPALRRIYPGPDSPRISPTLFQMSAQRSLLNFFWNQHNAEYDFLQGCGGPRMCPRLFFPRLGGILKNNFFLSLGKFQGSGRTAPTMGNAGDHNIALADHPLIAFHNGIPRRHLFQRRIGSAVIAGGVDLGQHQDQLNMGIGLFLLSQR